MSLQKKSAFGLLIFAFAVLGYYSRPSHPHQNLQKLRAEQTEIDDVVILVVDTLRADVLPWHGGDPLTAPFLHSIASRSVIFDRAYSGCSSTAPAMASVFTGRYPSRHGVITGLLAHKRLVGQSHTLKLNKIPRRMQTLPEFFKQAGFTTLGVADNLNISKEMGFAQGFDSLTTTRNIGAEKVTQTALEWRTADHKKRLFYIHYMDPHAPYHHHGQKRSAHHSKTEADIAAYRTEVQHVDRNIAELFEKKLWGKNSLIIFLADHGEAFNEHDSSGHGKNLHSEVIRVPMFIYHPSLASRRVRRAVHTADVLPTLADIFGWDKDTNWQGRSLLQAKSYGRPIYSELLRPQEHTRRSEESVIAGDYQLIVSGSENDNVRLYHIYDDLPQKHTLIDTEPDIARKLLTLLAQHRDTSPQEGEETSIPFDADAINHLKTLGYLQ